MYIFLKYIMPKSKREIKLKTRELRENEMNTLLDKLRMLNIDTIFPQIIMDNIKDHIENGTDYYLKHPWPEMNRVIELTLNNKCSIQNKINLLFKQF